MKEIRFRNAVCATLYVACFVSVCVVLAVIICIVFPYIFEEVRNFKLVLFIGLLVLLSIWILAGLAILLSKTVVITSEEIKMCRGRKVKWFIKKTEIKECIYNVMNWYDFLFPVSTINGFALQFRIKEKGISRKYCLLSKKQVRKIIEIFGYPLREIESIQEQ